MLLLFFLILLAAFAVVVVVDGAAADSLVEVPARFIFFLLVCGLRFLELGKGCCEMKLP